MTLTYDALKKENEELRQRAETAERELAADLPYRERWQQARAENQELRAKLAGMKQEWRAAWIYDGLPENTVPMNSQEEAEQYLASILSSQIARRHISNESIQARLTLTTEWKDADQEVKRG